MKVCLFFEFDERFCLCHFCPVVQTYPSFFGRFSCSVEIFFIMSHRCIQLGMIRVKMLTFHTQCVTKHGQEALSKIFSPQEKNRSLIDKTFILRSHQFTHCFGAVALGACDAVKGDPMLDTLFSFYQRHVYKRLSLDFCQKLRTN